MKYLIYTFVLLFFSVGVIFTPSVVTTESNDHSFLCSTFGWCNSPEKIMVYTEDSEVFAIVQATEAVIIDEVPLNENELTLSRDLSLETSGVSEVKLDSRLQEIVEYIDSKPLVSVTNHYDFPYLQATANREYVVESVGRQQDSTSRSIRRVKDDIEEGGSFSSPILSDAIISGASYSTGFFGFGTTTPNELLTLVGAMYLGESTPAISDNRLYNFGGDLYWNGSAITSSTTANWSAAAGDVFRLTGGVGIGTSTITDTFVVDGTASFTGTTTAPLVDRGGSVCDVRAYGGVGDNSTLNDAAIAAAIADCGEGGTVFFPLGEFRISQPIVLDRPVTLRGSYSPRWSYSSTPRSSIRADFASFAGAAMIHVRDRSISGETNDNNGGRLEYISLDGGSASTDVEGVYFEGLVRDWKLTDVDISQVTGNGFEAAVGTGSGNPRGFTIRGLSIYSSDGHGFRATALNDTYIDDLLSVGNALRGIYLSSMGETKIANSRAVFNGLTGLYIDGASNNGGLSFTDFSTDRNDRHGVRISSTGTSTIIFNGLVTRRDGPNTSGGSETPYAGVAVIGSTTNKVAPVFISGLGQVIGVDDVGAPPLSPETGVRVTNSTYVKIDGQLWGVTEAWRDDGGNDNFIIEDDSILKTGNAGAQELYANSSKWQATSTNELFFGNRVSIGSTTDSRLFNIVAPSDVAARMRDTTNDVTMDMRVEDFQAFLGTVSNHQVRFMTNNTSQLTIDTNGYIGIGTTSPDAVLDVVGTIQSSALLGGATNLTTDINGNIIRDPSDQRLKTNITSIDNGLERVLSLRGVTYEWKDKERFGDQKEIGFIAQEVDEVVPEVVRKGGEYWSLNTRNLVAVVVDAIQEMWDVLTATRADVEQLEDRVEHLESLLEISLEEQEISEEKDNIEVQTEDVPVIESDEITIDESAAELLSDNEEEKVEGAETDEVNVEVEETEAPQSEFVNENTAEEGNEEDEKEVEKDSAETEIKTENFMTTEVLNL